MYSTWELKAFVEFIEYAFSKIKMAKFLKFQTLNSPLKVVHHQYLLWNLYTNTIIAKPDASLLFILITFSQSSIN
jgi:hypothetical protein